MNVKDDCLYYDDSQEDVVLFYVELPGVTKEDVTVKVINAVMKITSKKELPHRKLNYEFGIRLSSTLLDVDAISAKVENGLLAISIPKKKKTKVVKID